jgi:hypothetical protein
MSYRSAFPDFDPATLPPIPDGWEDQSWHNDAMPCFGIGKLHVMIDFADEALRETEGHPRFAVYSFDPDVDEMASDVLLATDDWDAVVAFVKVAVEARP